MDKINLIATQRKVFGRKVNKLRREGKLPANIFGKDVTSTAIEINTKEFQNVFKEAGETKIVEISLGDKKLPTLIHSIQKDPVEDTLVHVDFLQVNLKQKVTAAVPLEFEGESPAEKQGLGTFITYVDEVEVEALPGEIPEKFIVDVSKFENVDDQIKISDLKYDKEKITITDDPEKIIAKVEELRAEEVAPEPVAAAEGETPTEGQTEEAKESETPEESPKE